MTYDYIRDGAAIYERSFATIRAEADLARFAPDEARVAVRLIHACGIVAVTEDLQFSPGFAAAARAALLADEEAKVRALGEAIEHRAV